MPVMALKSGPLRTWSPRTRITTVASGVSVRKASELSDFAGIAALGSGNSTGVLGGASGSGFWLAQPRGKHSAGNERRVQVRRLVMASPAKQSLTRTQSKIPGFAFSTSPARRFGFPVVRALRRRYAGKGFVWSFERPALARNRARAQLENDHGRARRRACTPRPVLGRFGGQPARLQ